MEAMYASMSVVSAILMEITKIRDISTADDIGKGRMDMVKGKFYQNVYVHGDSVQMRYAEASETKEQSGCWVYGLPVHELVTGMIKKRDIKVNYTLLCEHMKQAKLLATPETICSLIRSIGTEEVVPAWEKHQWEDVTKHYYPCQMFQYVHKNAFVEEKELRVVFTHQLRGHDDGTKIADAFRKQIEEVIQGGAAPSVTEQHAVRLKAPFVELLDKTSGPKLRELDIAATNAQLCGIADLMRLERVYYCMESCVAVVIVPKMHLEKVKTMLTNWSGLIQTAQKERYAVLYNHYLSHPTCLKPGVVLIPPSA